MEGIRSCLAECIFNSETSCGGARKDDGGLAGKPKKIRSAAVDGGEETEETEEVLTDVK